MKLSRRAFISGLLVFPRADQRIQVAGMETFAVDGRMKAVLVHHAKPEERDSFSAWLRANPHSALRLQTKTGQETTAACFRVRLCFGRGLLILDRHIPIREADTLTLLVAKVE